MNSYEKIVLNVYNHSNGVWQRIVSGPKPVDADRILPCNVLDVSFNLFLWIKTSHYYMLLQSDHMKEFLFSQFHEIFLI